jgi:hypothetical protein
MAENRRNARINMFWHGEKLSPLELACMRSFIAKGHSLRVYTYERVTLPAGVSNEDAGNVVPFDQFFLFDGSPAAFANIFRYQLLLNEGGWWADTDVLCLKSDLGHCEYFWAEEEPGIINNAVLKFPAGDPLCQNLLKLSRERAKNLTRWGQLGPHLVTEVLSGKTPRGHSGSTQDVYPIHWLETHFLWFPEYRDIVEERAHDSTFLHLWHSMFGRMGISLFSRPPAGGYISELYRVLETKVIGEHDDSSTRAAVNKYLQHLWADNSGDDRLRGKVEDLLAQHAHKSRGLQMAYKLFKFGRLSR